MKEHQFAKHLDRLRGPGARRAQKRQPSTSLAALMNSLPKGSVIVDVGCGESGDSVIARERGFVGYGLDLYRPKRKRSGFVQADAAALPLRAGTVDGVVSHAMVALLSPVDRWAMYREVARVLKPDGLFAYAAYPLADGHPVRDAIESDRMYDCGLHRKRTGLYVKCSDVECAEHPDPDSYEAIVYGLQLIDPSPDFMDTASKLVAWVARGGSVSEAATFAGVSKQKILEVVKGAEDCGIFNRAEASLSLPWMDHYVKDEVPEGNIALVLDVLAIRGEIERINDGDGLRYRAKQKDAQAAEPTGNVRPFKTTRAA